MPTRDLRRDAAERRGLGTLARTDDGFAALTPAHRVGRIGHAITFPSLDMTCMSNWTALRLRLTLWYVSPARPVEQILASQRTRSELHRQA